MIARTANRALVFVGGAVLVASGAVLGLAHRHAVAATPDSVQRTTTTARPTVTAPPAPTKDPHETAARDLARELLARFTPPPSPTAGTDPGLLTGPPVSPATPTVIDLHRTWTMPGDAAGFVAWLQAHAPSGLVSDGTGSFIDPKRPTTHVVSFGPGQIGFDAGQLVISAVDAGPGTFALRADAIVTWIPTRPTSQVIPTDEQQLGIVHVLPMASGPQASHRATITDPSAIQEVVTSLNALQPAQPGFSCPLAYRGEKYDLSFSKGTTAPVDATATVLDDGCGSVMLHVLGQPPIALQGNRQLIDLLDRLVP